MSSTLGVLELGRVAPLFSLLLRIFSPPEDFFPRSPNSTIYNDRFICAACTRHLRLKVRKSRPGADTGSEVFFWPIREGRKRDRYVCLMDRGSLGILLSRCSESCVSLASGV